MSKERELLKRAKLLMECSDLIEGTLIESRSPALIKDIEELLSQPEQEPVAWMHTDGDSCCTNNTKLYGGVDKGYSIPLYLEPPRRKTLREHIDNHKVWYQVGYEAAKQELGREPLSPQVISDILELYEDSISYDYKQGFVDGVLYAEMAHAITGVDDANR